jgi:hypothetical protein
MENFPCETEEMGRNLEFSKRNVEKIEIWDLLLLGDAPKSLTTSFSMMQK